ncbi:hypothetical protein ScPMuIL_005097 [Solemya velum]
MAGMMKALAETAIGRAVHADDAPRLKELLRTGQDALYRDRKGNTYIHFVSTLYRPHVFYILAATGIDIQAQNRHGNTALHVTALQQECGHVGDLMACGIDPLIRNKYGLMAFELKTQTKFWHNVYEKYKPGMFQAVGNHDITRIRELVSCWCSVNAKKAGQTLRQYAASLKYHDVVAILDESTPTLDAIFGVLEDDVDKVAEALKKMRCNINSPNMASQKQYILQYAIGMGDVRLVQMLCDAGADVNRHVLVNNFLRGPLYFEVLHPAVSKEVMWTVMKSGADFRLKDERGRNAMIFALDKCNGRIPIEVFKFMLKNGADIADRDKTGCTIRDVVRFSRRKDILSLIDKFYVQLLRSSDMEKLQQLAVEGYDGLLIEFNHRDSLLYASGNETDDALKYIEWFPVFQEEVKSLHREIKDGGFDSVVSIIEASQTPLLLLNARNKALRTPLIQAVIFNNQKMVQYLLARKDDINLNAGNVCHRTAYHFACGLGDDGQSIREQLEACGVETELQDVEGRTGAYYLSMPDNEHWLQTFRKNVYGMEVELYCVDKYEELRRIICSPKRNLEDFSKLLKRIHFPVTGFPKVLDKLMDRYKDLIFLALDYGKEGIARRLANLGADLIRKQKYTVVDDITGEKQEQEVNAVERARELGMDDLSQYLKNRQKSNAKIQLPKHIQEQLQINVLPQPNQEMLVSQSF